LRFYDHNLFNYIQEKLVSIYEIEFNSKQKIICTLQMQNNIINKPTGMVLLLLTINMSNTSNNLSG